MELTQLLKSWSRGEDSPEADVLERTYGELRVIASRFLSKERSEHTLQPTALVHEAYLRLRKQRHTEWQSREHFFAVASTAMRRVLIDHAKRRLTQRRGEGVPSLPFKEAIYVAEERPGDLVRLDDSLEALAEVDPLKAKIVELRYFAGLTLPETARVVSLSRATVARHWKIAMGWLYRELTGQEAGAGANEVGG